MHLVRSHKSSCRQCSKQPGDAVFQRHSGVLNDGEMSRIPRYQTQERSRGSLPVFPSCKSGAVGRSCYHQSERSRSWLADERGARPVSKGECCSGSELWLAVGLEGSVAGSNSFGSGARAVREAHDWRAALVLSTL